MIRAFTGLVVGFLVLTPSLRAQEDIQRGKIKKVDADKGIVTITADGKDQEAHVTKDTRIVDARNREIAKGLRDSAIKEGAAVMFKTVKTDGKNVLVGLKIGGAPAGDQGIRRAKVKKLDLDKMTLTLSVGDKDQQFRLTENTQVLDAPGKDLKERLRGFKEGSPVFFKAEQLDGREVLVGIKLADAESPPRVQPKVDTSNLQPLPELGTGLYQGFPGGLYADGKNERPAAHEAAGRALARKVQPLNADGKPSPGGKIVLLSVGMSNTSQSSQGFQQQLSGEKDLNPHLVFVNGAQGGMTAFAIQNPDDQRTGTRYWTTVDDRLKAAGVTRAQVQAVWIKQADAGPSEGFPGYARKLQAELTKIVQLLPRRFPNLKLVYLSSRTYGGYAKTLLNPEPYAYESGFAVKWLIQEQTKGDPALNFDPKKGEVKVPWLSWGPYLWANGSVKRADGFSYEERDFANDGTHQSASGQEKVGKLLLQFFETDSTTRPWFLK